MASRKRVACADEAVSDNTAHKRHCAVETKGPTVVTVPAAVEIPGTTTTIVAVATATTSGTATEPSTDRHGVSPTPELVPPAQTPLVPLAPSPADLYAKGLHYLSLAESDEAMPYLLRAAEGDHVEAALRYADWQDFPSEACKWYQRALHLAKGHSNEVALSCEAYRGLGHVAEQYTLYGKATTYYRQGALLGDAECQHKLGHSLHHGYSVPRDVPAAYYWYRRADAGGYHCAESIGLPLRPALAVASLCPFLTRFLCCSRSCVLLGSP